MGEPMKVYAAIVKVSASLSKEGISKDRQNANQGYKFRGIDDIYNALAPFLAEAKLCILPCVLERFITERTNKAGGVLFSVTVKVDFTFVAAEDGSYHHVITYGEAMDSGDKATNKAMSAAYKYACMQAFCIPTEGDNDADSKTHEIVIQAYPSAKLAHSSEMPEDVKEIMDLGKKAFNSSKLNFVAWMGGVFGTNDVSKLKPEQLNKAKNLLLDMIAAEDSK